MEDGTAGLGMGGTDLTAAAAVTPLIFTYISKSTSAGRVLVASSQASVSSGAVVLAADLVLASLMRVLPVLLIMWLLQQKFLTIFLMQQRSVSHLIPTDIGTQLPTLQPMQSN